MQEQQGRVLKHIGSLSISTQAALASLEARLLLVESRLASPSTSGETVSFLAAVQSHQASMLHQLRSQKDVLLSGQGQMICGVPELRVLLDTGMNSQDTGGKGQDFRSNDRSRKLTQEADMSDPERAFFFQALAADNGKPASISCQRLSYSATHG